MKKLLLGLIIVNAVYFVYTRFKEPEKENIIVYRGEKGVPLLVTMQELDRPPAVTSHVPIEVDADAIRNKLAAPEESNSESILAVESGAIPSDKLPASERRANAVADESREKEGMSQVNAACQTVGPFADLAVAKASRVSLEKSGVEVKNRKETRQITGAYWVYLPAYADKEQAQAASKILAENGIKDYFIISDKDNLNGISLGLYNQKNGSERRRADIAKLGFQPVIERKERQRDYWWLDIAPKAPVALKDWSVDGISKDTKLTARKCET